MIQQTVNIFGTDYITKKHFLNQKGAVVKFIPGYFDNHKDTYNIIHKLSPIDQVDLKNFHNNMWKALTNKGVTTPNKDNLQDIVDYYFTDKEFIFTENDILVEDRPLFYIKMFYGEEKLINVQHDELEPILGLNVGINIFCYQGTGNILMNLSPKLNNKISLWLNDYMFKRLEEDIVVSSTFFRDYWLFRN